MSGCILVSRSVASMEGACPEAVRRLAPDRELLLGPEPEEAEARIGEIEIGFGGPPARLLARATSLRWLQLAAAGAERVLEHLSPGGRLVVTNASGVHAIPASEHLLAMMLAFARGLHTSLRLQAERAWPPQEDWRLFEVAGSQVLLIGPGAIGSRFAEAASALGARVVALRRRPQLGPGAAQRVVGLDALRDELPQADFVVITAPLTRDSRHMIGEPELRLMKPSAILLNAGRGAVVDEQALVRALEQGVIAGAGLDVFETEPLPASSPLWTMPNVIVTAHYAGLTPRYGERLWAIFLDNLGRYLRGETLRNVVDPAAGY